MYLDHIINLWMNMMNSGAPPPLVAKLVKIAQLAGKEILSVYAEDFAVRAKGDESPVTEADERAEKIILRELAIHFPGIPVVAEELAAAGQLPDIGNRFFLVDPLDGTKEFINRNGEFTVNIALIENEVSVMGVVYAPARPAMYWGQVGKGAGSATLGFADSISRVKWKKAKVRKIPEVGATVLASRSHRDEATEKYIQSIKMHKIIAAGSSLKFCRIAAGEADVYPRFGRTMEWDTAAGHAVLSAAGGFVRTVDGENLIYGKNALNFANPSFIASAT